MRKDPFNKLKTASSLVAAATGSSAERTVQIQAAIDFLRKEESQRHLECPPELFQKTISDLLELSGPEGEERGFRHWDLGGVDYDPLFIRARLVREMKQLAGYREALLLITHLREALCPAGRYWTASMRERYREAIDYIERTALSYKTPSTRLNIIFV